jgi:Protein of unknown function (DUF2865)
LRTELSLSRRLRRILVAAAIIGPVALLPEASSAGGLFDFFFGAFQRQQPQAPLFADPFNNNPQAPPAQRPAVASSGPAFCVRSCDGKYFPLLRGAASPAQMCQAFCPASATKVFYGSSIDSAYTASGERYADSANAFAYRLGDVIATTDGLVAYSGIRIGNDQTPDFAPVASYPGLTAEVRARLNEIKVAPARADMVANDAAAADVTRAPLPPVTVAPKPAPARDKRADAN